MDYRRLGNSGLTVRRIALGCMSFGDVSRGFSEWSLGDEDAEPFFQQALELGINFWDTANVYGYGSSEAIVGRALRKYTRRDGDLISKATDPSSRRYKRSPKLAASRWLKSRWRGCCKTLSSLHPSSGLPSRTISPTP